MSETEKDLVQVVRLALAEDPEDVRLFVARLVRKYRGVAPEIAKEMELSLRNKASRSHVALRKADKSQAINQEPLPIDDESRLSLLKEYSDEKEHIPPILSKEVKNSLDQLIQERKQIKRLAASGLFPTRSAIFVGKPGVGKTLTAHWLAKQLEVPLYVLDLTAVMSSYLGRSGGNLRAALDFAKRKPCVLLLDEIDAIAKRRSDESDIGELKRLVTVILQEVDEWPETSLLLAATNHAELIDPALWRRFDSVIEFELPDISAIKEAIKFYFGSDYPQFSRWSEILAFTLRGESFSNIKRVINRLRRSLLLGLGSDSDLIEGVISDSKNTLDKQERINLSLLLTEETKLSQHKISDMTGVSRDTIRKYTKDNSVLSEKTSRRSVEV